MGFILGISICLNIVFIIISLLWYKNFKESYDLKKIVTDSKLFDKEFWFNDNK